MGLFIYNDSFQKRNFWFPTYQELKVPPRRDYGKICSKIKRAADRKKIAQKDLAEQLGITVRAYRYYEEGKRFPDFQGLLRLADCFQVSLDYLAGRTDERN